MVLNHSPSRQSTSSYLWNADMPGTSSQSPEVPQTTPTTLETLARMLRTNHAELTNNQAELKRSISSMDDKLNNVISRMDAVEETLRDQSSRTVLLEENMRSIESEVDVIKNAVTVHFSDVEEQIKEGHLRMMKVSNLIFMGVPEDTKATTTVREILKIILPDSDRPIMDNRVGDPKTSKMPRPMRIGLSSFEEKRLALKNCRKLKGHNEFKGISVKPDLTKRQIALLNEQKASSLENESQSRKRKSNASQGPPTLKRATLTDSRMDQN
jgi:hypothetical protein